MSVVSFCYDVLCAEYELVMPWLLKLTTDMCYFVLCFPHVVNFNSPSPIFHLAFGHPFSIFNGRFVFYFSEICFFSTFGGG